MAVGAKIKRIRNLRGLTLKELGMAVGFDEKTADIRIAQYESGTRTPKEELLRKISEALDVNYRTLYDPSQYAAEDIMFTLFELDEHYAQMQIYDVVDESDPVFPTEHKAIGFHSNLLDEFLAEWQIRKQELSDGIISREEYMEWKINWPYTSDNGGKTDPPKQWRKQSL